MLRVHPLTFFFSKWLESVVWTNCFLLLSLFMLCYATHLLIEVKYLEAPNLPFPYSPYSSV